MALVAAALLPAFAVGAIAVGAAVRGYRATFDDRLEATARALDITSVPTFIFEQKIFVPGAQDSAMFASLLDRIVPTPLAAG